jgi:hypothetical protein
VISLIAGTFELGLQDATADAPPRYVARLAANGRTVVVPVEQDVPGQLLRFPNGHYYNRGRSSRHREPSRRADARPTASTKQPKRKTKR